MTQPTAESTPEDEGSFAVPDDIDWGEGFGAEDLAGQPTSPPPAAAPAAPAPAPAAAVTVPVEQVAPAIVEPVVPPVEQPTVADAAVAAPLTTSPLPQQPVAVPVQQPVAVPVQQPVAVPVQQPVAVPVEQPAPVGQPAAVQQAPVAAPLPQQPAAVPVQQPVPVEQPAPVGQPAAVQQPLAVPVEQQQPVAAPVQQPVAAPLPQQPAAVPVQQPVPAQQPPATSPGPAYSTAPATGYAPLPELTREDTDIPPWAQIAPDKRDEPSTFDANATDEESFFAPVQAPDPVRAPKVRGKKATGRPARPDRKGPKIKPAASAKDTKASVYAGGRWKIKVLRVMVWSVFALLLLGGLKNVVSPDPAPDTDAISKQVAAALGVTAFPVEGGEGFAVRFTREYLTYDQDTADKRSQRLALYSPNAANSDWGWDGTGKQYIINGPFVAAPTQTDGKHYATVTVSAQLQNTKWVALAVPVYASDSGALVLAGRPAFVALPALAVNPGKDRGNDDDADLVAELEDVLPGFFTSWGKSDQTALARYITADATVEARTGLAGTVSFVSLEEVWMPTGKSTRTGDVTVSWSAGSSGKFTQTYKVTVKQGDDDRWSVYDVEGGAISPDGDALNAASDSGAVQLPEDTN